MNIVLSFVGRLPSYIIECVHQIRCFSESPVYLIIDDIDSIYVSQLIQFNVIIINYKNVVDNIFLDTANSNIQKFCIINELGDRKHLFIRAMERLFLLRNLMVFKSLENCFFMELDNLIYDDPNNWLTNFSKSELCYMFDNVDRCSSGIMYAKQQASLDGLLEYMIEFIRNSNYFMNEMTCLYR